MQLWEGRQGRSAGEARRLALLALGFRPFFLLAGLAGLGLMAHWVLLYVGWSRAGTGYYGLFGWHGHEMVFGYTVAVVAGFLLTAVRNWTERQTPTGALLGGLAALWLLGRAAPFAADHVPLWLVALVDLAFVPLLAVTIAIPLLQARQRQNLVLVLILAALTVANGLVHLEALGQAATLRAGLYLGIYLVLMLVAIIGGRVIPFFTERALPGAATRRRAPVEWTALGALAALAVLDVLAAPPLAIAIAAGLAAAAHGLRLGGWYAPGIWRVPLLWVLHLGYAWLVIGLALRAWGTQDAAALFPAVHAFTVGVIGVLTLGMMARVALGHTGRPLQPPPLVVLAFVLLNLGAVARVLLPLLVPAWYQDVIVLSGLLWMSAFLFFVVAYVPVLIQARIDGRPG